MWQLLVKRIKDMQPKPLWFVVAPIVTIVAAGLPGVVPFFWVDEFDLVVIFALG
jgi:hypothetical protein